MAEKLSITLPKNMVTLIKAQVQAGAYASTSEVLRAAMRTWMREEEERKTRLESLQARIDQSLADPRENMTTQQVSERLSRLYAQNKVSH